MSAFCTLAAVDYRTGFRIDEFLAAVARHLRMEGVELAGAIQENAGDKAACAAMTLVDLGSSGRFDISQDLGPEALGCRLDPRGLAEAENPIVAAINCGPDLIILNKFGKAEADGGGLRNAFVRAIEIGIPVLTAVRPPYAESWARFHGGLAVALPPDFAAVHAWCRDAARRRARHKRPLVATSEAEKRNRERNLRPVGTLEQPELLKFEKTPYFLKKFAMRFFATAPNETLLPLAVVTT